MFNYAVGSIISDWSQLTETWRKMWIPEPHKICNLIIELRCSLSSIIYILGHNKYWRFKQRLYSTTTGFIKLNICERILSNLCILTAGCKLKLTLNIASRNFVESIFSLICVPQNANLLNDCLLTCRLQDIVGN